MVAKRSIERSRAFDDGVAFVYFKLKQQLGRLVVDTTARVTGKVLTPEDHQRITEETAREVAA